MSSFSRTITLHLRRLVKPNYHKNFLRDRKPNLSNKLSQLRILHLNINQPVYIAGSLC